MNVRSLFVVAVALSTTAPAQSAKSDWQTGILLDVTHQDSSRVVGSPQSTTSVTDREYNLTIRVGDMTYVGSYWPRWKWSYEPTDLTINSELKVRLTKNELYILRSDNKELRTKIIKRIAAEKPR